MFTPFKSLLLACLVLTVEAAVATAVAKPATQPTWQAQWIWQEADGPKDTWLCLRKTVQLETKPEKALARIAADSKYWLWINGEMVVFEGQLRRDRQEETYYDVVDLAPYLKKGSNTLAALVWFWDKEGFSHVNSGKGGFLFEGDFGQTTLLSDATWKTQPHPAYEHSTTGGQPNMRLPVWNIRFNAVNDTLNGWQNQGYDDSGWKQAIAKGTPPSLPWKTMVERPFPQWTNSGHQLYEGHKMTEKDGHTIVEATLPYDARVTAYLKVKAPAGKLIRIQTDQYDGWLDFNEGPANRVEYLTKEGLNEFETYAWMSGNSVIYTIPDGVELIDVKYRELGYPSAFTSHFQCDDPFYNRLWMMARRTLYINMFDNYMDCPEREQALWWGDVVNQSGESFYTLDTVSHALIRKSILTLVKWQRADSTLFCPPSRLWKAELPQQILASIGWYGFWNYFMNTNDSTTIREAYPAVRTYLALWKIGSNGLVVHRKGGWDWGDWGTNVDIDILDNCWYYLALKAAIPMATMSGYPQDTTAYVTHMRNLETHFIPTFWQADERCYRSTKLPLPDDRANAMAVVAGLATPDQYPGILEVLKTQTFASPYLEKYVLEAYCLMNADTLALKRMKTRYTDMVNSRYTTLWEVWDGLKGGTINHGWNAPNTILSQYIAGLSPLQPGWTTFQVKPQLGGLTNVTQQVSTPHGLITVIYTRTGQTISVHIIVPPNTQAHVILPNTQARILTPGTHHIQASFIDTK
ncbi:MAG: glycoside hydrolase [Bacteroidales bacterium]|nr:glycoside hydrolase [Bacteroidales bacterium]